MSGKYLTVFNKVTRRSVPFYYNEFGEIIINSTQEKDNDMNCIVTIGDVFYENSQDYKDQYKKV